MPVRSYLFASSLILAAVAHVACSSDDTGGSSSGNTSSGGGTTSSGGGTSGGGTSGTSTSSFTCSINGVTFDCPDNASFTKCSNIGKPDTSGCTKRGGSSTSSSSSTSGGDDKALAACKTKCSGPTDATCQQFGTSFASCIPTEDGKRCFLGPGHCDKSDEQPYTAGGGGGATLCVPSGCPTPE